MSKATVSRLFVGSLLGIFGGLILMFVATWVAYANGALQMNGPDVTGVQNTFFAWAMVGFAIIGCVAMVGGLIGQFVAWIGAVINTAHLADKTWFIVLLVVGLLSFGFVAMLAYILVGPDGTATEARTPALGGRALPTA